MVLIERLETDKPVRTNMALGHALPLHASANGKAVLANSSPEVIRQLLDNELPRYTETTITDPDQLRAELAAIGRRGFAVNRGEWRSDVGSVAAAVMGGHEKPIASLSVNIPISRLTEESEAAFGAAVSAAATSLSTRLG
jgi:IclR family acetate operon transcriptional repressor